MLPFLADVNFANPLLWAILIGWILSVILHEFSHGLVASLGGDYTIRQRGGLTLNPLQYVDPVMSIILPAVFLLMGGIPLPGGATYIRHDLLRGRRWESAVAAAGPLANILLFFACALPLHPAVGWLTPAGLDHPTPLQTFLAAMAILQALSVILNLIPIPPLDGFQIISPYLSDPLRIKLTTPPVAPALFIGYFLLLFLSPTVFLKLFQFILYLLHLLGFDIFYQDFFRRAFVTALFGQSS
jgi:Zn-dependent protease